MSIITHPRSIDNQTASCYIAAMKASILKMYIGDRAFYRRALGVALPLMLQNVVTNFVSLLDNLMIGQTGTAPMSGVAVVGQLFFIFYLVIFGTISGPGIFCAQFWGAGDERSFKAVFRYKLLSALVMCLLCGLVLSLFGDRLIGLYLTGEEAARAEVALYAAKYLRIMLWGMLPYTFSAVYSSTVRETGRTLVPMLASWAAVLINLILNWVLIFGHLGAPALGAEGAAIATVISRAAEMLINMVWSYARRREVVFTKSMPDCRISPSLLKTLMIKSVPLMLNETLWCLGTATLMQIYSTRGLEVIAALNISYVLVDLFTSLSFSVGSTIGILVGQELGSGDTEKAVDTDRKLILCGIILSLTICLMLLAFSGVFPRFYNTTAEIRLLASRLICLIALVIPLDTFAHMSYFTIRSGGMTGITFLFDSGFSWAVNVPFAWVLAHLTALPILPLYALSSFTVVIKCVIGGVLLKRRVWVNTLSAG